MDCMTVLYIYKLFLFLFSQVVNIMPSLFEIPHLCMASKTSGEDP